MKVTANAKQKLDTIFQENGVDCLKGSLQESCCGSSVVFFAAKAGANDHPIQIDGVNILMDEETKQRAETITLDVAEGELVFHDTEAASGCC